MAVSFRHVEPSLVLQPGFMLADPSLPVAASCALLTASSPVGPMQDVVRLWTLAPDQAPEQPPHFGHREGQQFGGEIVLVLSPQGRPCAARQDRHAPAW